MKKTYIGLVVAVCMACQQTPKEEVKTANLGFDLSNLDTTVSPCEDFYEYVAGGWVKQNPIPPSESRWSNAGLLVERNNLKVKGLLDSVSSENQNNQESYVRLLSTYYASGMDSSAVEKAGLNALAPMFNKIDAIASANDYTALLQEFKLNGVSAPVRSYVGADDKNSAKHVLQISQSGLGLPDRDYYIVASPRFDEVREAYLIFITEMLSHAGADEEVAKQSARAIFNFEKELAKVSMPRAMQRNPELTYNKMSVAQVTSIAPNVFSPSYFSALGIDADSVVVSQPDFMKALSNLLPKQKVELLRVYARWNVLRSYTAQLPHKFVQSSFNFYGKALRGTQEMKPRWKRTIGEVESALGEELGRLFVQRYFPEESKKEVEQLVENLRVAYRQRIEALDWMGPETKKRANEKLNSFTYKIGYPNHWEEVKGVELSADYLQNTMRLTNYRIKENLAKLGKEVDRDEWFMPAHIVNAYYNPSYNEVVFPAGILQPPFYDATADMAINFGGIGGVIGHEFTHGFDDQGSKYNADGNLENWWKPQDSSSFSERTTLVVNQYGNYQPIMGTFINGELTLGENIADLGGLTLAYYGYKTGVENGTYSGEVIEGFTWQQRIFMGWGQVWQGAQTDEYTANQVLTDPHSPGKFRVVGPMSNMPEFAEAWGCQKSDKMVRADSVIVQIW